MIIFLVAARMGSGRLQNKVAFDLGGKPCFRICIERALEYIHPDRIVVTTTRQASDDPLCFLASMLGYEVYRGNTDLAIRELEFVNSEGLSDGDIIVQVSCDCPLTVWDWAPGAIDLMRAGCTYCILEPGRTFHDALGSGLIRTVGDLRLGMENLYGRIITESREDRVAVDSPRDGFLLVSFTDSLLDTPWEHDSLTLDFPIQAVVLREIYRDLYRGKPIHYRSVWEYCLKRPFYMSLLEQGLPIANQVQHPHGQLGLYEQVESTVDYAKIVVEPGGAYEVVRELDSKAHKNKKETK